MREDTDAHEVFDESDVCEERREQTSSGSTASLWLGCGCGWRRAVLVRVPSTWARDSISVAWPLWTHTTSSNANTETLWRTQANSCAWSAMGVRGKGTESNVSGCWGAAATMICGQDASGEHSEEVMLQGGSDAGKWSSGYRS